MRKPAATAIVALAASFAAALIFTLATPSAVYATDLEAAPASSEEVSDDQGEAAWRIEDGQLIIDGELPEWGPLSDNGSFAPWSDSRKEIESVVVLPGSKATTCYQMFSGCSSLVSIEGLENLDTSEVDDMGGMFSSCVSLEELNLSPLDTSNVTDMSCMFDYCASLKVLNLHGLNTSKLQLMGAMFLGCVELKELDLSSFDTSSVANMDFLFWDCLRLTKLTLGKDFKFLTEYFALPRTSSWYAYTDSGMVRMQDNKQMMETQSSTSRAMMYAINGWSTETIENVVEERWFDEGIMAENHAFYDPDSDAWYWADEGGTIAQGKDVFIPKDETHRENGGKWVRFDDERRMIKGEDCQNGNWYYFDLITGEMAKGEKYLDFDAEHTGWYYYNEITGIMFHGDTYMRSSGGKWVRYNANSGKMVKGLQYFDGAWYYFDSITGAMAHGRAFVPEWGTYAIFDLITGRG
ncbi:MAG: BspA family leucine-rich repeat surface protein [Phoenicibacter congonensis]|uniref:BspA family leucine-rich repeat surface protein n=1 Tax=Phoenicibacter congonensis TaxID=1944646 RepID=A0AA43U9C3_9ACTN|nr:BspA family leucine-rich repeat surface protein [Phoenicibacter congonensis]